MFNYKSYCMDCEMLIGEQREYTRVVMAGSAVTVPQIETEIAPFCMVADEFCDQLNRCPLEDL